MHQHLDMSNRCLVAHSLSATPNKQGGYEALSTAIPRFPHATLNTLQV